MKETKKMMVMEVKLAALSRLGLKVPVNISMYSSPQTDVAKRCSCTNNNVIFKYSSPIACKHHGKKVEKHKEYLERTKLYKEIRKEEVMAIRTRFPNKIPVIVEKYWKEHQLPELNKSKFLVPQDITMAQFQSIIRNRMQMGQNQALYLLVNERSMLSLSLTLGQVYSEHAGPNGFLHITYASQEVFG
ncbi:hypothetical protein ABEB36_007192 [Hypothenemus hampei]|uniref:Uncharacterized protein n=1 Tax=Hypothenemus hampei TaxID=57062 RepID=A0ABD1EW78_HYPHA